MKTLKKIAIFLLPLFVVACNNGNNQDKRHEQTENTPAVVNGDSVNRESVNRDSVITLQMHVKKGERFSFGYIDDVFNFNMIETPENPDTTIYEKKIISHKPIFLKDIDVWKQNFFYLIPGETYKIIQDSGFSNFEVLNNPKRTYEVNVLKELRKHNKLLRKFDVHDSEENYAILSFKNMDLKLRDSLLRKCLRRKSPVSG